MKQISGLSFINVELTDRCNKNCWMCGRRKREKENSSIVKAYGEMEFELLKKISKQIPPNIMVQFHNNGESLLYSKFGDAIRLFKHQIKNIVTNGKLLLKKYDEIVGNLDTIAISIFENDEENEEQYEIVSEFLNRKGDEKPYVILRCNGNAEHIKKYEKFGLKIAKRTLHSPMGSFNYRKETIVPEVGICLDIFNHLAIDKDGIVSICVRFDPEKKGIIGDIKKETLKEIWNSDIRKKWIEYHLQGKRNLVPLCSTCEFWGVPNG